MKFYRYLITESKLSSIWKGFSITDFSVIDNPSHLPDGWILLSLNFVKNPKNGDWDDLSSSDIKSIENGMRKLGFSVKSIKKDKNEIGEISLEISVDEEELINSLFGNLPFDDKSIERRFEKDLF